MDTPYVTVDVYDVSFAGWGGQPIRGWLTLPRARDGRLPCVVEFVGYGGGRGLATDHLGYASLGYAHLLMDTRGQGRAAGGVRVTRRTTRRAAGRRFRAS